MVPEILLVPRLPPRNALDGGSSLLGPTNEAGASEAVRSWAGAPERERGILSASPYTHFDQAWLAKARETLDNAQMRYFIVHLHRLLDPATEKAD